MNEGEARPCRACGMPIEFREGPDGRVIPLQRVRTVYAMTAPLFGGVVRRLEDDPNDEARFVSHFETCPHAGHFSKGKQ